MKNVNNGIGLDVGCDMGFAIVMEDGRKCNGNNRNKIMIYKHYFFHDGNGTKADRF